MKWINACACVIARVTLLLCLWLKPLETNTQHGRVAEMDLTFITEIFRIFDWIAENRICLSDETAKLCIVYTLYMVQWSAALNSILWTYWIYFDLVLNNVNIYNMFPNCEIQLFWILVSIGLWFEIPWAEFLWFWSDFDPKFLPDCNFWF